MAEYKISFIVDKDEKCAITKNIMCALRKWFNPLEDILKKAEMHREFPFLAAYDGDKCVGFAALKIHNAYTADIFNIGVLEEYHGRGIGSALVAACEAYCRDGGAVFLTVKTLDASVDYAPYEATRAFYSKAGFLPLEVFPELWNKENPCLFLAKYLGAPS